MKEKINWIDNKDLDYIIEKGYIKSYPGLIEALSKARFTMTDLGIKHRDATYWAGQGILPELTGTVTTRRKYTLRQAIWLKLVQQLRALDVSLSKIKIIKRRIFDNEINVAEAIESPEMIAILEFLDKKDGKLDEHKELMKDPSFLRQLKNEYLDIFESMILNTIIFRRDTSYIIDSDGNAVPYASEKREHMIKNLDGFDEFIKQPHILLSISKAYSDLIQDWNEKKWFNEVTIVSKEEMQILELLRENRVKELRIFKTADKPDRVIKVTEISPNAIQEFANYISNNGYQKIIVNTRKGKPVCIINETSIKL